MNPYEKHDLKKFIESIPPEEVEKNTILQDEENLQIHKKFVNYHKRGKCSFCKHSLKSFVKNDPCFHWLLLPKGVSKNDIKTYLNNEISFFRLQSYLRWIANTDIFMANINDLQEEKPGNTLISETIKYKEIEWTLVIGNTDKDGHNNSKIGFKPHYHLQIIRNGRIYLKFNDCHIFLTDDDLFNIECMRQSDGLFQIGHSHGEGFSEIENLKNQEDLLEFDSILKVVDYPQKATINRQTIITAKPGKKISGDLIIEALKESEKTKEPIGRIMARLAQEASVTTILNPSDNLPDMKTRNHRKKKNK